MDAVVYNVNIANMFGTYTIDKACNDNVMAIHCSMVCFVWLGLCLFQSPGRWEVVLGAVPGNSDDRMPAEKQ